MFIAYTLLRGVVKSAYVTYKIMVITDAAKIAHGPKTVTKKIAVLVPRNISGP